MKVSFFLDIIGEFLEPKVEEKGFSTDSFESDIDYFSSLVNPTGLGHDECYFCKLLYYDEW